MSIHIRVAGLVMSAIFAGAATAQTAVEWKVSEGGNGHWYQLWTQPVATDWDTINQLARDKGAHLLTLSSAPEQLFFFNRFGDAVLGLSAAPGSNQFLWANGEPLAFSNWGTAQCYSGPYPNNPTTNRRFVGMNYGTCVGSSGIRPSWDDYDRSEMGPTLIGVGLEWDADCNGDGIVDYGQILRGELIDLNSNGVPDICETSISSVIPPSVPSQGGSTITIRGNFPPNPTVTVGGVVATNVNRVSITQITATVPTLLPGMASVQVNDFTLPDAIYIRPECGSDLDQNGVVDAGDISIILLDFGPCYEPPASLAAPAPTPLLADEPVQKPTQR